MKYDPKVPLKYYRDHKKLSRELEVQLIRDSIIFVIGFAFGVCVFVFAGVFVGQLLNGNL